MDEQRWQRIEESVGFTERLAEQIHEQVATLERALDALRRRMDAMDARIMRLERPMPSDPSPSDDPIDEES